MCTTSTWILREERKEESNSINGGDRFCRVELFESASTKRAIEKYPNMDTLQFLRKSRRYPSYDLEDRQRYRLENAERRAIANDQRAGKTQAHGSCAGQLRKNIEAVYSVYWEEDAGEKKRTSAFDLEISLKMLDLEGDRRTVRTA